MRGVAKAIKFRRNVSAEHKAAASRAVLAIAGALMSVLGVVLVAVSLFAPSDASAFWALTGAGLLVSGALLYRRNRIGAWTYVLVFAATVSWSLRNVGHGASLAHRMIGPAVMLAMLAALMPPLAKWSPLRSAIAFAAIMLVTIGIGVSSTANGPLARQTAAVTQFLDSQAKGVIQ